MGDRNARIGVPSDGLKHAVSVPEVAGQLGCADRMFHDAGAEPDAAASAAGETPMKLERVEIRNYRAIGGVWVIVAVSGRRRR